MKRPVYSGTLALSLAVIVGATMFVLPTRAWSNAAEWTVYNTANSGLPYNGVTALAIDAQGTIWVGTGRWYALAGGGLAKFDGQNWTVYNTSNSGLPNNDHIDLSIDAQGGVWSATESGLSRFDGQNWTVYMTHNSGLPVNQMGCAPVYDAQGNAWIGTFGGGLVKFDGANWTVFNTGNSGLPNNYVWPIAFDADGNLWIGTFGGGLAKFHGANWTVYNTGNSGLPDNTIACLSFDVQRNLWIGTHNNGLAKFDGTNWMVYNTANSGLPHNRIWNLAIDPQGNIWAATGSGGLARFDGTNWTVYNTSNSGLPDNNVYCIAFDGEGNIWVGTQDGGLALAFYRPLAAVDFNGDGIVNLKDFSELAQYWGQDEPSVDIGPRPWGDGRVDIQDVAALAEYWLMDFSLVAHWKLDETEGTIAHDSISNKRGNLNGNPIWQPAGGAVLGALQLDGSDDYVSTPFVLNPADGPFSVFAWVKGGSPGQVITSQTGALGARWLLVDPAGGRLMTDLKAPGRGAQPLYSDFVITDGDWHHIGLVWDGSYRVLYGDGAEVGKDSMAQAGLIGATGGLYFGAAKDLAAASFFDGLIDDIKIYDRAITP